MNRIFGSSVYSERWHRQCTDNTFTHKAAWQGTCGKDSCAFPLRAFAKILDILLACLILKQTSFSNSYVASLGRSLQLKHASRQYVRFCPWILVTLQAAAFTNVPTCAISTCHRIDNQQTPCKYHWSRSSELLRFRSCEVWVAWCWQISQWPIILWA